MRLPLLFAAFLVLPLALLTSCKPGQGSGINLFTPDQDLELGRPMEIESQIMTPLAFAHSAGLDVPSFELAATLAARKAAEKGLYAL